MAMITNSEKNTIVFFLFAFALVIGAWCIDSSGFLDGSGFLQSDTASRYLITFADGTTETITASKCNTEIPTGFGSSTYIVCYTEEGKWYYSLNSVKSWGRI